MVLEAKGSLKAEEGVDVILLAAGGVDLVDVDLAEGLVLLDGGVDLPELCPVGQGSDGRVALEELIGGWVRVTLSDCPAVKL